MVNERAESRVARIALRNRRATTRQITDEFYAGASQNISQSITIRNLERMDLAV